MATDKGLCHGHVINDEEKNSLLTIQLDFCLCVCVCVCVLCTAQLSQFDPPDPAGPSYIPGVREREGERYTVCVCGFVRENECEKEGEVCVQVCERERERDGKRDGEVKKR